MGVGRQKHAHKTVDGHSSNTMTTKKDYEKALGVVSHATLDAAVMG